MINEVRVDRILEVAALIVGEKNINSFGARIVTTSEFVRRFVHHAVVVRPNNIWMRREKTVCLDFFQRLRHGLLAEWTTYFLQGEQFRGTFVLDQVDIGKSSLHGKKSIC